MTSYVADILTAASFLAAVLIADRLGARRARRTTR